MVEPDEVEGFRRGRKLDKVGLDAQDTSELFFDDVWVPADNLLGLEEGKGFYQLMAELPRERLLIAIGSAVGMERAIEETIAYVKERKAFGKPIIDCQNSQFVLADARPRRWSPESWSTIASPGLAGTLDATTAAIAKLWVTRSAWRGGRTPACSSMAATAISTIIRSPGLARRPRPAHLRRIERDHEAADRALALEHAPFDTPLCAR